MGQLKKHTYMRYASYHIEERYVVLLQFEWQHFRDEVSASAAFMKVFFTGVHARYAPEQTVLFLTRCAIGIAGSCDPPHIRRLSELNRDFCILLIATMATLLLLRKADYSKCSFSYHKCIDNTLLGQSHLVLHSSQSCGSGSDRQLQAIR
jgi:hypothetical protein